ncbi:probable LRR receptor-like serine/threonine-protein kinase At1g67720 [Amborella trichopoda]|uniref:probable LRR receptor-like serine/threonine-protein kinase At1g67720 n=1 Tax=Amborella trichopoda TaxID=13333 RepID=UPI0005D3DEBA|nr:probable LRR receptor-like serine/threonine-protein kinase At1g67720 [Amborella trichopoda]|eukprot:XP_011626152.1 probable LRR receptor-like serine/threonine-protein kinase At1g67720 [Amborella trichopoda]
MATMKQQEVKQLCFLIWVALCTGVPSVFCHERDFISIDCGGTRNYTDPQTGFAWVSDTSFTRWGKVAEIKSSNKTREQYQRLRYFPADNKKYCYTLNTVERKRYIVRATFLYGNFDNGDPYPNFQLYLDATRWSTVKITDASRIYIDEMIIRAPSSKIDVCVCDASTGFPFISTLELRPLNVSMYATEYEDDFFLSVAARVNFGAATVEAIRYPDDPYDRIWESDLNKRPNFLVGAAPGTMRINTSKTIEASIREFPPVKVMQTAVIGTKGILTYRLTLDEFPANARAYAYLAEIEDLGYNETRKFTMKQPHIPEYNNAVVNIVENANGSYILYEPSFQNVTLEFVLLFSFEKTPDSTRGPLINAIEINRYVQIIPKTSTQDAAALDALRSISIGTDWMNEGGDACVPAHWSWLDCNSGSPPRITKIFLSGKNLSGEMPSEIKQMDFLTELWLNGNSLTGSIPGLSNLVSLTVLHLENNKLSGHLPSFLGELPNLKELYVQNNLLTGEIPPALLAGKLAFYYDGNPGLTRGRRHEKNFKIIIATSGTLIVCIILLLGFVLLLHIHQRRSSKDSNSARITSKPSTAYSIIRDGSLVRDESLEIACYFTLTELEEATEQFSRKIGQGSFGPVYYGKVKDSKEVAVKILAATSTHGTQQFVNEVTLLSRIHHRNLVPLIGYCEEGNQRILVYEYMHNGTLRDHIHDPIKQKKLDWMSRLYIAEDAAKGLEYLHGGCIPSIIHRDVKTSNILLDIKMRAKVSDFGLSRCTDENRTHISSAARGTVGYLDPEYYGNQQLTERSDVYSFGIVLLELISGRKPISVEDYGSDWNIVHWARSRIRKGAVKSIIDPQLGDNIKIESVWKMAEIAILSVESHMVSRPTMQSVVLAIQDAIKIEKESLEIASWDSSVDLSKSMDMPSSSLDGYDGSHEVLGKYDLPTAR